MGRTLMIHNRYMPYRRTIFNMLQNKLGVEPTFISGNDQHTAIRGSLVNLCRLCSLALRVWSEEYSAVIGGSWDSLWELAVAIVVLILCKAKHIPFVIWTESWNYSERAQLARKLADPLIGGMIRHSDAFIVPGTRTMRYLASRGASRRAIFRAPNACDPPEESAPKGCENEFPPVVLFLGRLIEVKGIEHLIEAMAILKDRGCRAILVIAGEGPLASQLRYAAKSRGLTDVIFVGCVRYEDRYDWIRRANVVVLPSVFVGNRCEAWGLVLNEAMLMAKPIVATWAVGAAYDLIEQGHNGFTVPPGDAACLAQAIERTLGHKAMIRMGKRSQVLAERFSLEKMLMGFKTALQYALPHGARL